MGALVTTTIDFGAYPGKAMASVIITGQTGITVNSLIEAFVDIGTTAQHNLDEHKVAPLDFDVSVGDKVVGIGFTIFAIVRRGRAYGIYNLAAVYT